MYIFFLLGLVCSLTVSGTGTSRVRLALRHQQEGLKRMEELLWKVSDPLSPSYGHYLSTQEMREMGGGASQVDIERIGRWLKEEGRDDEDISVLPSGDVIEVVFPLNDAVKLFKQHKDKVLPREIQEILKVVVVEDIANAGAALSFEKGRKLFKLKENLKSANDANPNVQKLQYYGMRDYLRGTNPSTLQMVWGPGTYGASTSDLNTFFGEFNIVASSSDAQFPGYPGTPGGDNWVEGTLDAQYIMAFAPGVKTIVMNSNTSSSTEEGNGFGYAFLWELMSLNQQTTPLPQVISLSLGSLSIMSCDLLCNEVAKEGQYTLQECNDYMNTQRQVCMYDSVDQVDRMNTEMMKLGLAGVSIFAATGDGGSHFSFEPFDDNGIGHALNIISCKYNSPTFPAASPYVTGVGGVDLLASPSPIAWSGSGSGFSWQFPMPDYQKDVVNKYLSSASHSPRFPSVGSFNSSNRAYPDVSAAAINVPIVLNGTVVEVGGTSASTPTFAGIISLINDYRFNHGLKPLGFLNPRLYHIATAFPGEAFADIVSGNSATSCSEGFPATVGWDPVTGFGYPLFPGLLKHLGTD